jgi:WD40 repeat protein
MGYERDLLARMRLGITKALRRVGGMRRVSGTSIVAMLCASALAPVVAAGAGPVMLASMGVVGAVGADVLTDVINGALDRLRRNGGLISEESIEAELAARLEEALEAQGEAASSLREAVAAVLQTVNAVSAVMEAAAAHEQELLPVIVEGFTGLGEQFTEFAFVIGDMRRVLGEIEGSLRQQQSALRVEQERAREHALTLLRVLEAVDRKAVTAADLESAAADGSSLWRGCPYLGLVPFEQRDARVFYGRNEMAGQLAQRLWERLDVGGMLLVVGPSGAGKSSLLRAGLMPRLAAGALGPGSGAWPRRVIRPTAHPVRELAMHLADVAALDPVSVYKSLAAAPDETPLIIERAVRTATGVGPDAEKAAPGGAAAVLPPRLVIVIDQLEELFTAGEDGDAGRAEREAYIAALHAAATVPVGSRPAIRALVVVAVRGDFLDSVMAYPPLAAAVDAGPFAVGPMSEAELRLAITGPAAEAGLSVEPALLDAVITDLRGDQAEGSPGSAALPLVSQAMAATWERREIGKLSLRAYQRAGGTADAVNRSAQDAYETLTGQQQDAARFLFTQLTIVTPDGQLARRRCSRTDQRTAATDRARDIAAAIDAFAARRLLILDHDSIEISHDVLLHAWKQLRDWLSDDQLDRTLYSQVVTDAQTWDTNHRDPSYLYQPGRLTTVDAAATRWADAPTRYPPLSPASRAFLSAARHAAHRTAGLRRAAIAVLATFTLVATTAAGIAAHYAANASRQHAVALSRQLAAESLTIDRADPVTARRLAAAAWRIFPTRQAKSALTTLVTEQQQDSLLFADPSSVAAVAFSPGGKLLASADRDGTVRLWDPATRQPVDAPMHAARAADGVNGVAFSPDGKLLASADGDGTVRLWAPATGQPVGAPMHAAHGSGGGPGGALGVAFSPDGKLLASADGDGTVRLWDPATGQPVGMPMHAISSTRGGTGVNSVAFSPDGKLLASAEDDGTVRLWDPVTDRSAGAPLRVISAKRGIGVNSVAFSPDGKLLASADGLSRVRLWDPATGQPVGAPIHAIRVTSAFSIGDGVNEVAFSPSGKLLASADGDGTMRLWNPATGRPVGAPVHAARGMDGAPGGVHGVAFSPDGKLLASADGDGTMRLWNPATGQPAGAPMHAARAIGGVRGVAFSPDGKLLASADSDGTVRLWDPGIGQPAGAPMHAARAPEGVDGVAFSPDGKLLASADGDGTVRLWDPATGRPVRAPMHAISNGSVSAVAFSPDGKLLASGGGYGTIRLWNPATGQPAGVFLHAGRGGMYAVAFSPNGKLLASADGFGIVRSWDPATGQPAGPLLHATHIVKLHAGVAVKGVNGVAFSPDGKLLASGDENGNIRLWDPATGQPVGVPLHAGTGTPGGVLGVAFSPDGKLLASADGNGNVRLWDPATGQPVGVPLHAAASINGVLGVAFSPNGKLLASADGDGTVRLWNVLLFAHPYAALCADVGPPTRQDWHKYAPGEPQPRVCV